MTTNGSRWLLGIVLGIFAGTGGYLFVTASIQGAMVSGLEARIEANVETEKRIEDQIRLLREEVRDHLHLLHNEIDKVDGKVDSLLRR